MAVVTKNQLKKLNLKRSKERPNKQDRAKRHHKTKSVRAEKSSAQVKNLLDFNPDTDQLWTELVNQEQIKIPCGSCAKCGYRSKKRSDVIRHVRCVHLKIRDFECPTCGYKCFGASSLNQHVKSVHLKIKDFSCGLCGYLASRGADVNKHLRSRHKMNNAEINRTMDRVVKKVRSPEIPLQDSKTKVLRDITSKLTNKKSPKVKNDKTVGKLKNKEKILSAVHEPPPKCQIDQQNGKKCDSPSTAGNPTVHHGRPTVRQTSAVDGMMCHVCNYSCDNRAKLYQHFEKSHIIKCDNSHDYKCAHCQYASTLKVIVKSHIITTHTPPSGKL